MLITQCVKNGLDANKPTLITETCFDKQLVLFAASLADHYDLSNLIDKGNFMIKWNKCHNTQTLFLDSKDAPSHETKADDYVQ